MRGAQFHTPMRIVGYLVLVLMAAALGWGTRAPTWNAVLRGPRPMAVPDIQSTADSLAALIAMWQTLGKGPAADQAVVNVVLAADRGQVPDADAAFAVARSGSVNSPVISTGCPSMLAVPASVTTAGMAPAATLIEVIAESL